MFSLKRYKSLDVKNGEVKMGPTARVGQSTIEENVNVGPLRGSVDHLYIGRGTYATDVRVLGFCDTLRIGRYCSFGFGITMIGGEGRHILKRASTYPFPMRAPFTDVPVNSFYPPGSSRKGTITIGNDVWIGHNAVLTQGIKVGNGAVIAISAVVTGDVPPYAIVAGNPADVKSFRHDKETIEMLEQIAWWDWPVEKIKENMRLFELTGPELKAALQALV